MAVTNKSAFGKGMMLLVSFSAIFILIMSPMMKDHNGNPQTGLEYADEFFNKLSKNSADYFDQVNEAVAKQKGKQIAVTASTKIDLKAHGDQAKAQEAANKQAQTAAKALQAAGAQVEVKENSFTVKADLQALLEYSTKTSHAVFKVVGKAADEQANVQARATLKGLWTAFEAMQKPLQKDGKVAEAKAIDIVMKKGIEPAYNFYGISGEPVSKNIFLLTGLLAFYVIYTMWYGYGIFYTFEGLGMSMKKSKKKH
ncbi:MAG: hypothetical protein ACOZEN_11140 [Thermodesulfobacteriota bacterium]